MTETPEATAGTEGPDAVASAAEETQEAAAAAAEQEPRPARALPQDAAQPLTPKRIGTDIALIAVFAALIAVCALLPAISIGAAVPITLQTFAVMLAGAVLGARRGFLAVALYLVLGAIGLPVFSGGAAGLGVFAGPSVGYLAGFPLAAALTGLIVERLPRTKLAKSIPLIFLAGFVSSIIFIHPLGIFGMMWRAGLDFGAAALTDLAFWPGDIIKNILMALVATVVHRAFPQLLPSRR